jgi:hypothetical protein
MCSQARSYQGDRQKKSAGSPGVPQIEFEVSAERAQCGTSGSQSTNLVRVIWQSHFWATEKIYHNHQRKREYLLLALCGIVDVATITRWRSNKATSENWFEQVDVHNIFQRRETDIPWFFTKRPEYGFLVFLPKSCQHRREPFHSSCSLVELMVFLIQQKFATCRIHAEWKYHLSWVAHEMNLDLRRCRLENCGRLLPILKAIEFNSFRMLATGDKSEFVFE